MKKDPIFLLGGEYKNYLHWMLNQRKAHLLIFWLFGIATIIIGIINSTINGWQIVGTGVWILDMVMTYRNYYFKKRGIQK